MAMAFTSPLHAAAGDEGGQDVVSLQDTLSTQNAHDTEDKHEMKDAPETEAHNKKEARGIKGRMQAVLDTTELLELILLYFSTKDLTRTLTVSKHWQTTILGSIALRRNLFLDSVPIQDYLDWAKEDGEEHLPFLCSEPTETSLRVVKLHLLFSDRRRHRIAPLSFEEVRQMNPYVEFGRMTCASLGTVHPSTLLLQPPLEEMRVSFQPRAMFVFPTSFVIKRTGGVTFGDLLEQWITLCEDPTKWTKRRGQTCSIAIFNALSTDADAVIFALGTLSKAKYAARVKELDTDYIFEDWKIP